MNDCAFTICAKNYIGLAAILGDSIKKYTNHIDFYIVVADEFDNDEEKQTDHILVARNILGFKDEDWNELTFKYNITEFCTCLKPFSFLYLFNKYQYKKICYFDPDIYFFGSPKTIYEHLNSFEILLTPHNLCCNKDDNKLFLEDEIRFSGIFNFGFIGLKQGENAYCFLEWWSNRLKNKCFIDIGQFLFTDQKWGDFLPAYFPPDVLHISRCLGWNVAPWNFVERKIIIINGQFHVSLRNSEISNVDNEALVFVHFSGYDYTALALGRINQNNIGHDIFYDDLKPLFDIYAENINSPSSKFAYFITKKYTYNYYTNGMAVENFHRRLFRGCIESNIEIGNPFDSDNKMFFRKLKKEKMFSIKENTDKINRYNVNNITQKIKIVNFIMRIIYKCIPYKYYILLLKLFRVYSCYENQVYLLIGRHKMTLWSFIPKEGFNGSNTPPR
jgi:hypothetical protein